MATQICPECNADSFTWYVDDDDQTKWGCYKCSYYAIEDESRMRVCLNCDTPNGNLYMKDKDKTYWWCVACEQKEIIKKNDAQQ